MEFECEDMSEVQYLAQDKFLLVEDTVFILLEEMSDSDSITDSFSTEFKLSQVELPHFDCDFIKENDPAFQKLKFLKYLFQSANLLEANYARAWIQ